MIKSTTKRIKSAHLFLSSVKFARLFVKYLVNPKMRAAVREKLRILLKAILLFFREWAPFTEKNCPTFLAHR